ncbi:hypothetical protein KIPB_011683, partial [Kipferlia bialata]
VYAPGCSSTGDHIDIVLAKDNDGPQKKQILLNVTLVLPVMSHIKSILKTMASATGCLAPGTRAQKDHERNGTQLLHSAVWAVATLYPGNDPLFDDDPLFDPSSFGGTLSKERRAEILANVDDLFDTSSVEGLVESVLSAWCIYNSTEERDEIVCRNIVDGTPLDRPKGCYLPPAMQELVEPILQCIERGGAVPALVKVLRKGASSVAQGGAVVRSQPTPAATPVKTPASKVPSILFPSLSSSASTREQSLAKAKQAADVARGKISTIQRQMNAADLSAKERELLLSKQRQLQQVVSKYNLLVCQERERKPTPKAQPPVRKAKAPVTMPVAKSSIRDQISIIQRSINDQTSAHGANIDRGWLQTQKERMKQLQRRYSSM